MRRIETYVGQQVYEWAFSAPSQYAMTAMAKVCAAMMGTSGTINGLACTPTSPATMTVQIGAGELYQNAPLEATACGTLPADTSHTILKQGIQLNTYTTSTFAAPTTSGQSINYLIEAQYQDSDISLDPTTGNTPVVLQFYNANTPASPWSGPNNSGATSNTFRDGIVAYQIKAGVAATTGSQATPSPDTGWIGLWVVTVPFGATSLTSSNISQYSAAPILPTGMLQSIMSGNLAYGVDGGSANTIQASFPIPVTTVTENMDLWVKIKAANTGATTFTPNPGTISASPVVGAAHAALQGGELVASGRANLIWRQDITSWVLVECTGAAIQVAPATQSAHAVQFSQIPAIVGQFSNLKASAASGATSVTFTADTIVVGTALNGLTYRLTGFSQTFTPSTAGAGGMDTGSATAGTIVAVYAGYNPSTGATTIFGTLEGSAAAPTVYAKANAPSGYTATSLLAVVPISTTVNAFAPFNVTNRATAAASTLFLNGTTSATSLTSYTSFTTASVPKTAAFMTGSISVTNSISSNSHVLLASSTAGTGAYDIACNSNGVGGTSSAFRLALSTPQTIAYAAYGSSASNVVTYGLLVNGWEI
ncbi:hypothetical protein SAMN05443245_5260 [Paraburkholderia fungorum]|uniref:Uncharacterized protein n=1 Tax=Paraburkholderia fungorum TaxID=134537 RepID=A0A1H1IJH6_9BURK|nr:hypothetical protein [Paraburkholderia fungorum]SDR37739.1 hypothetical protein SAMN05443245_5260 [Paraburkholderia fungorum]